MEKNKNYIGVEEKNIPEEERYVQGVSTNSKKKKATKIYIIVAISVAVFFLIIFTVIFITFIRASNATEKKFFNLFDNTYNTIMNESEKQKKQMDVEDFNDEIEWRVSEVNNDGDDIKELLSNIVKSNSKNTKHTVKVNYNEFSSSNTNELNNLITQIDSNKEYTITKEYDSNGYINVVNIFDN